MTQVPSGQTSIETLLIALIVLMISATVLGYYTSIQGSTSAVQLFKVGVLEKIGEMDEIVTIKEIDFTVSGATIDLSLCTEPDSVTDADLGLDLDETADGSIRNKIAENTGFDTVNVNLNGTDC